MQNADLPSSQLRQWPQATLNGITTRSPFFSNCPIQISGNSYGKTTTKQTDGDTRADFVHDAHVLVAEDYAGLSGGTAFVHVEITDRREVVSVIMFRSLKPRYDKPYLPQMQLVVTEEARTRLVRRSRGTKENWGGAHSLLTMTSFGRKILGFSTSRTETLNGPS